MHYSASDFNMNGNDSFSSTADISFHITKLSDYYYFKAFHKGIAETGHGNRLMFGSHFDFSMIFLKKK